MAKFEIVLCGLSRDLVDALRGAFAGTDVAVERRSILEVSGDAIVSPANSFGYMDGGLDLLYSEHFGWEIEKRVRDVVVSEWDGELPVGNAIVVPVGVKGVDWLVSAPTMRVPMPIPDTTNAFLAFKAVSERSSCTTAGRIRRSGACFAPVWARARAGCRLGDVPGRCVAPTTSSSAASCSSRAASPGPCAST